MVDLSRHRTIARLAKSIVPRLAPIFSSARSQSAMSLSESAFAIIQGKGAGSGWDIEAEHKAALRFIKPGATVLDVGANRGEWSTIVFNKFHGNIRLFMFEPQEACCNCLRPLVDRGAVLIKAAVGETEGSSTLYTPGGTAGNASLHPRKDTYFDPHSFSPVAVNVISLDPFLDKNEIAEVDFMKMDIEGHELFVLRGAERAIATRRIKALSFEFGSGNINSRTFFRDYWDLLSGHHYLIYRLLPGGNLVQIHRYDEDLEYFRGVSNYIATLPDNLNN